MDYKEKMKELLYKKDKYEKDIKELATALKNVKAEIDGINGYIMRGE